MLAVETLLNTLPDSLAMALVLFVFLYLVYLCLATVAFLFLRETHGFVKLALLPFTASFIVVQQLFAGIILTICKPPTENNSDVSQENGQARPEDEFFDRQHNEHIRRMNEYRQLDFLLHEDNK